MDERMTELEIRYTDMEATIESLQDTVLRQQQKIDSLIEKFAQLESRLKDSGGQHILSPSEESPPPHY
jgi:SlyX protein